jgi:hypothetical protein
LKEINSMKAWKNLHCSFIVLLVFMLFGCGSTPSSLASPSVTGMDLDTAIKDAATQMETRIPSGTMIALVSVASPSTAFSTQVLTRLESAIVGGRKLVVVDRANLDKIRAEQGFQLSGEVDDESAKSIGKLLGAGAIVTGSLTDLGDVYSLTLKAINIQTATVAVSYLADLIKTTRIETLLATRDGVAFGETVQTAAARTQPAASGGTTQAIAGNTQPATSVTPTPPKAPPPPVRYTVTFNANGANGRSPFAQTVESGEKITIPDRGEMINPRGTFGGWNTRADGTGRLYTAGDTFTVSGDTQLYAHWIEKVYNIGDTGPAGGLVFFDMGFYIDGWRYLEAAPQDYPTRVKFANRYHADIGVGKVLFNTDTGVGTGKQNTSRIVSLLNEQGETLRATQIVGVPKYGGYDDWFLPSRDELNMMYKNLKNKKMGEFSNAIYWSSSSNIRAGFYTGSWQINFSDGCQIEANTDSEGLVRAVRRF